MSRPGFDAFRRAVLADPALQAKLRDIMDTAAFIDQALALGQTLGYAFTADELRDAMRASRRAWAERGLQ